MCNNNSSNSEEKKFEQPQVQSQQKREFKSEEEKIAWLRRHYAMLDLTYWCFKDEED